MAVKSILEVEIDPSGNFAAFQKKWDGFQKTLADSPKAWAKVTEGIGRSRKEFDQVVKLQVASIARARLMADADKEAVRLTTTMADRWRDIGRSTRSTAANVRDMTTSILKWSAITGVISGLVGAGGLFGISRLAQGVAGGRQQAFGQGSGYGEQRSFGINFSRLVDPGSFLSSVAEAKGDITKRVGFYGAGLGENDLKGTTADTGVKLLDAMRKLAKNTDPRLYSQVIAARGLGQFASADDFRRLAATSDEEYGKLRGGYRRDINSVDLSGQTQRAWQDLNTQLTRAGDQIENTFVKGLLPLVPGLEKLSDGVQKTIAAFLGSDTVKKWMTDAGQGLETLAKYVATPEFEQNVMAVASGLGAVASAMARFLAWFGGSTLNTPSATAGNRAGEVPADKGQQKFNAWANYLSGGANTSPIGTEAYIREAAIKRRINPDVAVAVARSEGLNNYIGDKGTSFGPFQLHYKNNIPGLSNAGLGDEFTKATGLHARDPNTVKQQVDFALDQALRGGWGPWHGYRGGARDGLPSGGTSVRIENNTGGNAILTTNTMAGQN